MLRCRQLLRPRGRFAPDVVGGSTVMWSSWFAALATEVSAVAASLAVPERASGSDARQTGATRRQERAERPTDVANAHTGNASPVPA